MPETSRYGVAKLVWPALPFWKSDEFAAQAHDLPAQSLRSEAGDVSDAAVWVKAIESVLASAGAWIACFEVIGAREACSIKVIRLPLLIPRRVVKAPPLTLLSTHADPD